MADQDENLSGDEKLLATARKQFEQDCEDEKDLRADAETDLKMEAGDQWDPKVKAMRLAANRPVLTFNRSHTFVQQVGNEGRQNKPQIKFIPAEDGDKDTADVYEGLARHIQSDGDAGEAHENALECAAAGSFGYFRYLTEYCDDDTFDQDLKVVPVHDPFSVYGILIPACFGIEPDHAFVIQDMPKDQYERMYGESKLSKNWETYSKEQSGWVGTDTVKVAEYWYVEESKKTIKKGGKEREVTVKTVKFCKMNGCEILEGSETEWPGYCIPIIPVLGKKRIINGKPVLYSVIRFQRDPQRLINFYKTRIAETLGTAPIQPYMVMKGQVTPALQPQWMKLNTSLVPYLEYEGVDIDGKPAPRPERQVFEAPIASLSAAAAQEIDDMKATAGIFDASLGARSNENSGRAILARQQQSDITNLHFMDNLERAFKKGGAILADVIPKVYDTARMIRILGADEAPKIVKINQEYQDDKGKTRNYKIGGDGVAKYDVVVTIGKAFSTKRLESFDTMTQVVQAAPDLMPIIADIMFKNSDVAGADQLAERFKKNLPPNLQDDQDGQEPIPPQVQAKMQQLQMAHDAIDKFAQMQQEKVKELEMEKQARVVDNEYKMQQIEMQEKTKILIAEITTKAQESQLRMEMEQEQWKALHGAAHDVGMAAVNQSHEQDMQGADQQHQADMQQQQTEAAQQSQMTDIQAQQASQSQQDGA